MDTKRPYLVIPKLVEQPTWGGQYIADVKGWLRLQGLDQLKIGQSYELFSGSNLSLCDTTLDSSFFGEITDRDAVQVAVKPKNGIRLDELSQNFARSSSREDSGCQPGSKDKYSHQVYASTRQFFPSTYEIKCH